jgi:hypothetical protein
VLIELLRLRDRGVNQTAIALINRIAGERAYDPAGEDEVRKRQVDLIERWWRDNGATWIWVEDRTASAGPAVTEKQDPLQRAVRELASPRRSEATAAEGNLLGAGEKAVPALIGALGSADAALRAKAHDLLKQISKQDHGFSATAPETERAAAIGKWRKWAIDKELIAE